jgi:hypothetical protein
MKLSEFFETHEWTTRTYARDAKGTSVVETSPEACSFCLSGAIYKLERSFEDSQGLDHKVEEAFKTIGIADFVWWNDHECKSKEELIAKLKELGL